MTQPMLDWDGYVSMPVSGRTPQARHSSATGAQASAAYHAWLRLAYRDLLISRGPTTDQEAHVLLRCALGSINSTRNGWNRAPDASQHPVVSSGDYDIVGPWPSGRFTKRVKWMWRA